MSASTQLQALIDALGAQEIMDHLTGAESDGVSVGAQLSKDYDGALTQSDITFIQGL
jgi:hypothetical protein